VFKALSNCTVITLNVPGSSSAHIAIWNKIHGLMLHLGMLSFYLTINPTDIYNSVIQLLAGEDIDIDQILPKTKHDYWGQPILVAKNPVIMTRFSNIYMKVFIKCILEYDPK
ncbi:hypothetical protein BKA93DRAFT_739575, partial [Sparassis latifolia]